MHVEKFDGWGTIQRSLNKYCPMYKRKCFAKLKVAWIRNLQFFISYKWNILNEGKLNNIQITLHSREREKVTYQRIILFFYVSEMICVYSISNACAFVYSGCYCNKTSLVLCLFIATTAQMRRQVTLSSLLSNIQILD